jgi:DNA-binding NarL/FixJ family response regulator
MCAFQQHYVFDNDDDSIVLTERQIEVIILLAQGFSNREIAELLLIEVSTVDRHVHNIFGRLGMKSRVQAAVWATQQGLLDDLS